VIWAACAQLVCQFVRNAIYRETGQRLRDLPIRIGGFIIGVLSKSCRMLASNSSLAEHGERRR
jgi:hypothetical protein